MPKINVTVELDFDRLPDADARDLARQMLEGVGFNVTKVAVKAEAGRVKDFMPKAYAPGWSVKIGERMFTVWGEGPNHKSRKSVDLWMVPADRQPGDASVYRWSGAGDAVRPYHGDGKPCASTWSHEGSYAEGNFRRVERPCSHPSHTPALVGVA